MSTLDWVWRWFILTKFYSKGWGRPTDIKRLMLLRKRLGNREEFKKILPRDYPVYIDKEDLDGDMRILEGHFQSPVNDHCPGIMPQEVEMARFQMVLPTQWKTALRPICVHMGGTGDHGFTRRRKFYAQPLLKEEGIASVILENPYYGCRKPKEQFRSGLLHVSDLFVMGAGLIMEGNVLFNWLDRQGYGPLGASGVSMGGHMASLAATNWHKPISLIPCMSGSTASGVFTHGVLSTAIPWKVLVQQYQDTEAFSQEILRLIESPEPYWKERAKQMYREGRQFFQQLENNTQYFSPPSNHKYFGHKPLHICGSQNMDVETLTHCVDSNAHNEGSSDHTSEINVVNQSSSAVNQSADTVNQSSDSFNQSNTQSSCLESETANSFSLLSYISSFLPAVMSSKEGKELHDHLENECKLFMRGVMDECTHLGNFSVPVDPALIVMVRAENDAYVPHKGYLKLVDLWPGSELRTLNCGHIAGYVGRKSRREFRKAIADSFEIHARKYYNTHIRQTPQ